MLREHVWTCAAMATSLGLAGCGGRIGGQETESNTPPSLEGGVAPGGDAGPLQGCGTPVAAGGAGNGPVVLASGLGDRSLLPTDTVVYNLVNPAGPIAVDCANVYFTLGAQISKCAIDGCRGEPTVVAMGAFNEGLAVDTTSIYWSQWPGYYGKSYMMKCPLAGCTEPMVLATNGGLASAFGTAIASARVFWGR
jgi:hypothetical protein